jgi:hypothetical protein
VRHIDVLITPVHTQHFLARNCAAKYPFTKMAKRFNASYKFFNDGFGNDIN